MTATTTQGNGRSARFVLVHGGWCGGFVYSEVAALLRRRGHHVHTPTLTGLGARSHLLRAGIGLATHIQDVVNAIKWDDLSDVVLVGHSYGGMVITGVADEIPDRIASIVYLDAFLPENGQSIADLAVIPEVVEELTAAQARGDHALPFLAGFAEALSVPSDILWKFTPQPLSTLVEPIRLTGKHKTIRKKTFVWATKWPDHERVFRKLQNDPSWNTVTVPTGHMIQWEVPERCVEILEDAAS